MKDIYKKYKRIGHFYCDRAIVYTTKYGAIDINGNEIIPTKYTYIDNFNELGLTRFSIQDDEQSCCKWGIMDIHGVHVLPAAYSFISSYDQEFKFWKVYDLTGFTKDDNCLQQGINIGIPLDWLEVMSKIRGACDQYGIFTHTGSFNLLKNYNNSYPIKSGNVVAKINDGQDCEVLLDRNGQEISSHYNSICFINDNIAIVKVINQLGYHKIVKYGIINCYGKEALKVEYDEIQSINNGQYFVLKSNSQYEIINEQFVKIHEESFDFIGTMSHNSLVFVKNGKCGIMSTMMHEIPSVIVTPKYDYIDEIANYHGLRRVCCMDKITHIRYSDLLKKTCDELAIDCHYCNDKDKWGLIDKAGNVVLPPVYSYIPPFKQDSKVQTICIEKEGIYGCINNKGYWIVPLILQYKAKIYEDGNFKIQIHNRSYTLNQNGHIIKEGRVIKAKGFSRYQRDNGNAILDKDAQLFFLI